MFTAQDELDESNFGLFNFSCIKFSKKITLSNAGKFDTNESEFNRLSQ